jgi:hypothetical protein
MSEAQLRRQSNPFSITALVRAYPDTAIRLNGETYRVPDLQV